MDASVTDATEYTRQEWTCSVPFAIGLLGAMASERFAPEGKDVAKALIQGLCGHVLAPADWSLDRALKIFEDAATTATLGWVGE